MLTMCESMGADMMPALVELREHGCFRFGTPEDEDAFWAGALACARCGRDAYAACRATGRLLDGSGCVVRRDPE